LFIHSLKFLSIIAEDYPLFNALSTSQPYRVDNALKR
jgi:hypothetical protein